ncbi:MAG TPA: MarR family transcriptional regulator [Solirubrobacterales bacterium]|jgi:DNA-binding MarR family transcriptional regulator|nr:MarR family transcriptional regulator [Solirubrobacterales bacterium]
MASRTKLANEAWEALFRAQRTIYGEFERSEEVWGSLAPTEYGVLYALSTAPGPLRITELCDDVLLSQPGMSRLIARLEGKGLLERVDDPSDARASRVRMTAAGVRTQRQVGAAHAREVGRLMTRGLDRDELTELRDLSLKLVEGDDE